jgi:hypothetical protein
MLLRHYIVAAKGVTSALALSCFERQRAQRFIKQVYRCNQWLKIYQIDDKCHNVACQTRDLEGVTSPI